MNEIESKRLELLLRHVNSVRDNCEILGRRLIEEGEVDLGFQLIAQSQRHDQSKFYGIEWLYLHEDIKKAEPLKFNLALIQHQKTNFHHPEAWPNGVHSMPDAEIAEMCCDWRTRANEFSSDLRDWIKTAATKRFDFTTNSVVYKKKIKRFVDLLLETPFK